MPATAKKTAKRGRPTVYTKPIAHEICARMAKGDSLREICRTDGMPDESTIRAWAVDDREGFYPQYARARQIRALHWADDILAISDDGSGDTWTDDDGNERVNHDHIQRSKLRVDTRKWLLSKVLPKIYGDKLEISGDPTNPVRFIIEGAPTAEKG